MLPPHIAAHYDNYELPHFISLRGSNFELEKNFMEGVINHTSEECDRSRTSGESESMQLDEVSTSYPEISGEIRSEAEALKEQTHYASTLHPSE